MNTKTEGEMNLTLNETDSTTESDLGKAFQYLTMFQSEDPSGDAINKMETGGSSN